MCICITLSNLSLRGGVRINLSIDCMLLPSRVYHAAACALLMLFLVVRFALFLILNKNGVMRRQASWFPFYKLEEPQEEEITTVMTQNNATVWQSFDNIKI